MDFLGQLKFPFFTVWGWWEGWGVHFATNAEYKKANHGMFLINGNDTIHNSKQFEMQAGMMTTLTIDGILIYYCFVFQAREKNGFQFMQKFSFCFQIWNSHPKRMTSISAGAWSPASPGRSWFRNRRQPWRRWSRRGLGKEIFQFCYPAKEL